VRKREPEVIHSYEVLRERVNLEEKSILVDVTVDSLHEVYRGRLGSEFSLQFMLQQLYDLQHFCLNFKADEWQENLIFFTP
jgi:hypothetical protein